MRFWQANDIYPLFFVWETGFAETLKALLLGSLGLNARELAARGNLDRITDRTDRFIENRAHEIGRPIWSGMKRNAERAHDSEGAGTYVARKLHELIKRYKDDAGAI